MKDTISLDSLWAIIESLPLKDKKWLFAKLQENIRKEKVAIEERRQKVGKKNKVQEVN